MKYSKLAAMVAAAGLALGGVCATAQAPTEASAAAAAQVPLADQPTDAQIAKLFEVMRVKQQMASVTKMMPQIMQQQFTEQMKQIQKDHPEMTAVSPEKQKQISDIVSKYMRRAMAVATSDDMLSDMGAIYKRHLSREDVDGAIAYYSSPAGEHFLEMVPVMMQELMPTVMHRTQEQIKPIMDEMQKELMQLGPPSGSDAWKPAEK